MVASLNIFLSFFVFLFGACIGSFFKLIIDRYEKNESIVFKSSYCEKCEKKLLWWHNLPLLSFLLLRGRCYFCGSKIQLNYFFYELITGFVVLLMAIHFYSFNKLTIVFFASMMFVLALILLSMFDIRYKIIPHVISYFSIVIFLLISGFISCDFYMPFLNLGVAFLSMDILNGLISSYKKTKLDSNVIFLPVFLWLLIFLFIQNLFLLFVPILLYFIAIKSKSYKHNNFILLVSLLTLLFFVLAKDVFFSHDAFSLHLLFVGVGIIYFICEILTYFIGLFFPKIGFNVEVDEGVDSEEVALGGGDITVFVLISVFLGFQYAFLCLFMASLLAVFSHIIYKLLSKGKYMKVKSKSSQYIPFVPFIVLACFIILVTVYGWYE